MTYEQKALITKMRRKHLTYTEISNEIGVSVNTIKSFCRRNGLLNGTVKAESPRCKNCGDIIISTSEGRPRLFCSDHCKQTWWNKHRCERVSKNIISHVCRTCGKPFNDYSGANRKYCSQACYRERNTQDGE